MAFCVFSDCAQDPNKISTVHCFCETPNGSAPMHEGPDKCEQLAISALHSLQFHCPSQTTDTGNQLLALNQCSDMDTKADQDHVVCPRSAHLTDKKRIVSIVAAFLLTVGTIVGILQLAHFCIYPRWVVVWQFVQNVFVGDEKGVRCNVWSISPMQQLTCTLISFTNGYVQSLLNDVSRELMSKQWGALPTCIGYVCTTGGALYLNYIYIVRRLVRTAWHSTFSLYRAYYLAFNNPMLPVAYIEKSVMQA